MEALRYDLVKNRLIGNDISISLSKMGVDCLKIEIRNANLSGVNDSFKSSAASLIGEDDVNMVKFLVNASVRNKFSCKLIKLRDQPINRLLVLTCDVKDQEI